MRGKLRFEEDPATPETHDGKLKKTKPKQRPPEADSTEHSNTDTEESLLPVQSGAENPRPDDGLADGGDQTLAGEDGDVSGADSDVPTVRRDPDGEGKLKFSKEDKEIGKLEEKAEKYSEKLDKAREKLPSKKTKKKERSYDESKGKATKKLRFDKEPVPIGEAKWNQPKKLSAPSKGVSFAATAAVNKLHVEVYKAERDNVGTQAAHRAELLGESAYRGGKGAARSAYRFHKNKPYRKAARLETKSIKNEMKLSYKKALRENPKLKSNPVSRMMQKRKIKRQYAAALRKAKKSAVKTKQTAGIMAKATKLVTALIRRNPALILKICILLLLIIAVLSLFSMCAALFSGGGGFIGAVSYAAEIEDIELAALNYTEWETDLRVEIENAETTHTGYDEYRYNIGFIGHDPFQLMAFLTAVYEDFIYADVESALLAIFAEQYQLEFVPEVETRIGVDPVTGEDYEYDWHILNVILTSKPFSAVIADLMDDDQKEHFDILMQSKGARQFVGNPFDFDWLPFVTSYYGYRIHPIHGDKRLHRGIDIALPEGTEIRAGLDGTVVEVGYDSGGYGNFVVIDDGEGVQARYAHCHTVFVTSGQTVSRGDVIATVGNTGASTGAHLHMEVLVDGAYFNPLFFVEHR